MKDTLGNPITEEEFMKDTGHGVVTQDWKEEFVKELSYKVKHFCCGQYEEHSVEMDAFQSGVSTAIGIMSIDLLGGVKSKGMLELYTEDLLKEERNAVLNRAWEYVVKASREEHGSKEDFIKFVNEHE